MSVERSRALHCAATLQWSLDRRLRTLLSVESMCVSWNIEVREKGQRGRERKKGRMRGRKEEMNKQIKK